MSRKVLVSLAVVAILLFGLSTFALATELEAEVVKRGLTFFLVSVAGACVAICVAAFGGALGQGISIKSAVEGIARNPEASGKITVTLIIGLALIESLVIYSLVIALIVLFANTYAPPILKFLGM